MLIAWGFWCEYDTISIHHKLLRMRYWLTQLLLSVHSVLDYSHSSLIISPHVNIILDIVIRSRLSDRQVRLVMCPPIILCSIHILDLTPLSWCVLVLTICEHLLVIDRSQRSDLLVEVESPHDYIWIVFLNHSEINHPHTTLSHAVR
jgi:hypothetical protein